MLNRQPINRTMDLDDLHTIEAQRIVGELNDLIESLKERGLAISSWWGWFNLSGAVHSPERLNRGIGYTPLPNAADDRNFPWFLYWEIVWVVLNNSFAAGQRILDLGGSSSLFSYYLASKGWDVTTVDQQHRLVDNGNRVAQAMHWNLRNLAMDMRDLKFDRPFDHITSICVFEHIPLYDRIEINTHIRELLVDGGTFTLTFDYRNPSRFAHIYNPDDVDAQFVKPSGLTVRGNRTFVDTGKNYLICQFYAPHIPWVYKIIMVAKRHYSPREFFRFKSTNDYTFGALFMEKT